MLNLRAIELYDIENLNFNEYSLHWDGYTQENRNNWDYNILSLKVNIESSTIKTIGSYTFKGRITVLKFSNVTVEETSAFALTSLHFEKLNFVNVYFKTIKAQSFKKFTVDYLTITDSTFVTVPSRSFSDVEVKESFVLNKCNFNVIRSGGFILNNLKVCEIMNLKIGVLEGDAFKVSTRGNVLFINNTIDTVELGAFKGFSSNRRDALRQPQLILDSNEISLATVGSFMVNHTSFAPKVTNLYLRVQCDCNFVGLLLTEDYLRDFNCILDESYASGVIYNKEFCKGGITQATTIIIVCVCLIMSVLVAAILIIYYKKVYRSDKYDEKKKIDNVVTKSLIVPDGRTYRETEIHVIVERSDLLTTDL